MKVRTMNEKFEYQSKKRKNRKKKLKFLLAWLKFILTLGLTVTVIVFIALSPLFDIKDIEVKGASHYKSEELKNISAVNIDENGFKLIGSSLSNIFSFRIGSAEYRLKSNCPYLSEATVRFVVPSHTVITVKERTQYALVAFEGTSLVIDKEGFVLETVSPDKKFTLPYINGLKLKDYKTGSKLKLDNTESFANALSVIDIIQEMDRKEGTDLYKRVDSVNAGDLQDISVSLDKRVIVKLGDLDDLNYRISAANTIFTKNIRKDQKGVLDFTSDVNPVFSPESGA
jgi:cell division protein FtsQ